MKQKTCHLKRCEETMSFLRSNLLVLHVATPCFQLFLIYKFYPMIFSNCDQLRVYSQLQCNYSNQGHPTKFCVNYQVKILDVNNIIFPTNYGSKQTAHYRSNTFVTIFIVLTLKRYWSICKEFTWVSLVGVVALYHNDCFWLPWIQVMNKKICWLGLWPLNSSSPLK